MTTPRATPGDEHPSATARTRLAAELSSQVATSRIAWDAALLRSDAALESGDAVAVQAALEDHRLLLRSLEEQLGTVVAAASASREARPGVEAEALDTTAAPVTERRVVAVGRRVASGLAGAAVAVLSIVGLLGLDEPVETDGQVARSEVAGREDDPAPVEPPPAPSVTPPPAVTPAPATAPSVDAPGQPDDARPDRADDGRTHDRPSDIDASPGPDRPRSEPDAEEAATEAGPEETALDAIPEREVDGVGRSSEVAAGVGAGTSRPVHELAETLRETLPPPPASEPSSGLG